MIKVSSQAAKVCVAKVHEAGQEHVFSHWEALSSEERKALLAQLREVDFQLMKRLVQQHLHSQDASKEIVLHAPETNSVPRAEENREEYELCRSLGEYAFKNGEVSLVTASGSAGEGPNAEPVGLMPVGPVTGKSVFQLHAEKVRALNRRHKVSTRWYIFCHPHALEATGRYFKEQSYFGLNCSDIQFHAQDVLPVVNRRGKLLLSNRGKLSMHTKGEGDILLQLLSDEFLNFFDKQNIKYLYYFQADNALVKIGDLVFLGNHIKNEADMSSKYVRKNDPNEDLGVFGRTNGCHRVIPRHELDNEESERREDDGSLMFHAGNIGNHIFSIRFLQELRDQNFELPFHRAACAMPYIAKNGRLTRPTEPNCVHFQTFIADALLAAKRAPLMQVDRKEEFSPIRNTAGKDSPQTAQRDLSELYANWLRSACANGGSNGEKEFARTVEISPLYAIDADELKEKIELPVDMTSDILL